MLGPMKLGCCVNDVQQLDVDDVRVALGIAVDRVLSFVTMMFVELRSLEAVREKDHLCAATPPGLCFGSLNESLPETATAVPLVDPDVGDHATASPCVTAETGYDFVRIIPNAPRQESPIRVSCCLRIEFVDAFRKKGVEFSAIDFLEQSDDGGWHDIQLSR